MTDVNNQTFGSSLANCGDLIDSDGDCLAVGCSARAGSTGGEVLVYDSAAASGLDDPPIASMTGADNGKSFDCTATFGFYVANASNVDGSTANDDLLVGAPGCDNGHTDEGVAFLYKDYDGSGGLTVSSWIAEGGQTGAWLGVVAGVGDTSGDGVADFAVAAPLRRQRRYQQRARLDLLGRRRRRAVDERGEWSHRRVDFKGRRIDRGRRRRQSRRLHGLHHGEVDQENGQTDEGRYCVYHGGPGGPDNAADKCAEGGGNNYHLGAAVAMGDFNGDGYGDVVVGAPGLTNGSTNERRITVIFGQW